MPAALARRTTMRIVQHGSVNATKPVQFYARPQTQASSHKEIMQHAGLETLTILRVDLVSIARRTSAAVLAWVNMG